MILKRPLIFYDVETTGINIANDRIISISAIKYNSNKEVTKMTYLINPEISIPAEATAIHGITDDMVKNQPTFKMLSKKILEFMEYGDLVGYNNNQFDNPILQEEFFRCGIDFPTVDNNRSVDTYYLFKTTAKRNLAFAYKYYCGKELKQHHNSESDAQATMEIFFAQIEKVKEFQNMTMTQLNEYCNPFNRVDWQERIIKKKGEYYFNFGNVKMKKIKENLRFLDWMQKNDFPNYLKAILAKIKKGILQN
jgi:DNA polymerase III subunit epsilon